MSSPYELILERIIDAPPAHVYRCWTEPALMVKWFTPRPWSTVKVENDVRAGGSSLVVMRSPEGEEYPNFGIYLEVVPHKKIVFTDAFTSAWIPKDGAPFFVGEVTFEETSDGKTKYKAVARHWTQEASDQHAKMGFHEGWGKAADQLQDLARTL